MSEISIIVPIYNVEKYIGKCLDTLVNQTFRDIEIILVDDGSPDESGKIYEGYAARDNRIKVIKKKNAGVSEARNTGIENATGQFLMFIDSDDWMELDGCERLYQAYQSSRADLVVADVYLVQEGKKHLCHVFKDNFYSARKEFIQQYQIACIGYGYNPHPYDRENIAGIGSPWNKLFKREIVQKHHLRFDPYVKGIYDDNLFVLHYLENISTVCYIQTPVYDYRLVSDSLTQAYKANTLDISQRIFTRINEFISAYHSSDTRFEKAFYMYVIRRLNAELGVYYFPAKCDRPLPERCRELKHTLHEPPYAQAIHSVAWRRLRFSHQVTLFCAKLNVPWLMYAQYKARRVIKSFLACSGR